MTPQANEQKIELLGRYAAFLSLIEVALGSVLHSLRIPFSGNFLSLNQGYLLCRATLEARKIPGAGPVAFGISNVAAVLKSLAPAGKKLGPMLSLGMQGLLFQIGVWAFGASLPGLMLGMALLSLWTFLQPLITYYLFFGSAWFTALHYLFEKTVPYHGLSLATLGWLVISLVVVKVILAMGLAVLARRSEGRADLQDRLLALARERGARPLEGKPGARRGGAFWLALRDLTHPLFLFSLAATVFFLALSQHSWGERFWILLRPIAVGFLFFYFSRTLTLDRWLARLHGTRGEAFARSCESALGELRRFTNGPRVVKQ